MSGKMAFDPSGDLYVIMGTAVWKITSAGVVSVVAGKTAPDIPVPGPAVSSPLGYANGLALDPSGNLFISDSDVVEKVTSDGTLSLFLDDSQSFDYMQGITADVDGAIYVTPDNRVVRIAPNGRRKTVVGGGPEGAPVPGPVKDSPLGATSDVLVAPDGSLYVSVHGTEEWSSNGYGGNDGGGWVVRVDTAGTLAVIAGNGSYGTPIPGSALSSPLGSPGQLAMDDVGNLYVADTLASMVLEITPGGALSVKAGSGASDCPVNGPATNSPLGNPEGIAFDGAGNLYVSSNACGGVSRITPDGTLHTVFAE